MERDEIRGRLFLWEAAINETKMLISMAIRCENAAKAPTLIAKDKQRMVQYHQFRKQLPDYKEGEPQTLSQLQKFDQAFPPPFPDSENLLMLKRSNTMLAVVMYSQIYNIGYEDNGKVAKNTKEFVSHHMNEILKNVFGTDEEREKYEEFVEFLLTTRNRMLGHADGPAFEFSHGSPVTSFKLHTTTIGEIDLEY